MKPKRVLVTTRPQHRAHQPEGNGGEDDHRLEDALELPDQDQEDQQHRDHQGDAHVAEGARLLLELAAVAQAVAGGQLQLASCCRASLKSTEGSSPGRGSAPTVMVRSWR
jgi:hypothetical protein